MNRTPWMEDFQKNLSDLLAKSPAADVERNVRAMMSQAFTKMDLVTREEFDVQADLLARTRAKLDALTARIDALEARQSSAPYSANHASSAPSSASASTSQAGASKSAADTGATGSSI